MNRDLLSALGKANESRGEPRLGVVTAIDRTGALVKVKVDGRRMPTPIDVSVGDLVMYWSGPKPYVLGSPVLGTNSAHAEYAVASGRLVEVFEGEDLDSAISTARNNDHIIVDGDHRDDSLVLEVSNPIYLQGNPDATEPVTLPRIRVTTGMSGLWMSGFTVRRETPVDSNSYEGIQTDGGPLVRSRFFDIEITGHGLSIGLELNRRWRNDRNVIHNVRVHEIENRGFWLNCDYLRTWGLEAHDLYRTVDQSFLDVDAVNFVGLGQHHSGFWFRDIIEANSISTDNTGVSAGAPHPDGFQSYNTKFLDNATAWLTSAVFEDGVIDLRSGGRQALILESNSSSGAHIVSDVTVRRCLLAGTDAQVVNVKGVDGFTMEDCDVWIVEDGSTTFRAVSFKSGSGGGATTNPNAELTNNRVYVADGQGVYGGTTPSDLEQSGNTTYDGQPPITSTWTAPVVQRPSEAEVLEWLEA